MDVRCPLVGGAICGADRLAAQAVIYGDILQACLDNVLPGPSGKGGCKSFETWGFTDRHTWLWTFENPTHSDVQPLPYSVTYAIKPAYTELLATLQAK